MHFCSYPTFPGLMTSSHKGKWASLNRQHWLVVHGWMQTEHMSPRTGKVTQQPAAAPGFHLCTEAQQDLCRFSCFPKEILREPISQMRIRNWDNPCHHFVQGPLGRNSTAFTEAAAVNSEGLPLFPVWEFLPVITHSPPLIETVRCRNIQ